MPYQLVFAMYLVATTVNSLLARNYAVKTTLHPLVSGISTKLTIALPLALMYALLTDGLVVPTARFAVIAVVEAVIGSTYGMIGLYAQKHADAATFATLIKTHVVIVVIVSSLLLGEALGLMQVVGVVLLMASGFVLSKGVHKRGLQYNLLAVPLLSFVVILSRIMVRETNVGTYLVTSTTLGLLFMLAAKGQEFRRNFSEVKAEYRQRSLLSVFTFLQVLAFMLSVDLSGNVSYISSLASLKVITVMVASYIFLNERSNAKRKIIASTLSLAGLLMM